MKNFSKMLGVVALSAVSASAVLAQNAATPEEQPFFPDVPRGHWAFSAVQKLAAAGIIEGRPASASRRAMTPQESAQMAALLTPKIKNALMANAALKGATINVDTSRLSQTVTLSGTVVNPNQALLASQIALQAAPGSPIVNRLKITSSSKIRALQSQLTRLQLRRARIWNLFMPQAPELKAIDKQIAQKRAQLQREMQRHPAPKPQPNRAPSFQLLNG